MNARQSAQRMRSPLGRRLDQRGFTLVETLIAAFILVIVFAGLAQFYVRGRIQVDYEEDRRKATAVGQQRLEEVRRWSYGYLLSREALNAKPGNDTTMVVDGRTYKVSITVNRDTPITEVTQAAALVKWSVVVDYDQANKVDRTLTVTTLVGRRL